MKSEALALLSRDTPDLSAVSELTESVGRLGTVSMTFERTMTKRHTIGGCG